jgi:hypothetical protein
MKFLLAISLILLTLGSIWSEDLSRIDATPENFDEIIEATRQIEASAQESPVFMSIEEDDNTKARLRDFVRFVASDVEEINTLDPTDTRYQQRLNNLMIGILRRYNSYKAETVETLEFYDRKFEETDRQLYAVEASEERAILSIIDSQDHVFNPTGLLGERIYYNHTLRMRRESDIELYGPPVDIRRERLSFD